MRASSSGSGIALLTFRPWQKARPHSSDVAVPAMPVRRQDVPAFERQVEGYINDLAAERAKQLEQTEAGK